MLKIRDFARLGQVSIRTLRYYDELGILSPVRVNPDTGYRLYAAAQLAQLHRILALKDLGFPLEDILPLVHTQPSTAHLRALLHQKLDALQQHIRDEQARLQRVEARLQALEQEIPMSLDTIVLKRIDPLCVIALHGQVATDAELTPLFAELATQLNRAKLTTSAPALAVWDDHDRGIDDEGFDVLVALPIAGNIPATAHIAVQTLPAVETMACVVHQGNLDQLAHAYEALHRWVQLNDYRVVGPSRTVYINSDDPTPSDAVIVEVQLPVSPDQLRGVLEAFLNTVDRRNVTERARQVIDATIMEVQHDNTVIQPQHLLIGLLSVENSLAAVVLHHLGLSVPQVRAMPLPPAPPAEIVINGMHWSALVRDIIVQSAHLAQELGHAHIGTEHILLALIQQPDEPLQAALTKLGLQAPIVAHEVHERLR
jgi:DNA-binding transcriptional MerR regulator